METESGVEKKGNSREMVSEREGTKGKEGNEKGEGGCGSSHLPLPVQTLRKIKRLKSGFFALFP